jgi:hypothetical protein
MTTLWMHGVSLSGMTESFTSRALANPNGVRTFSCQLFAVETLSKICTMLVVWVQRM